MAALYDTIGHGYVGRRRPDPRIAAAIEHALGDAASVVNVGAGAGSYEPVDRRVLAIEPSLNMVHQRAPGAAPAVRADASALPLPDASHDASLAVLTVHHWPALEQGLAELVRVARRRVVVFTHDPDATGFWLEDYFPAMFQQIRRTLPPLERLRRALGHAQTVAVAVPPDCLDGFLCAYWCRPEAYLDARNRAAISSFAMLPPGAVTEGLARLDADLRSGAWEERNGNVRERTSIDLGYRILVREVS
jgi:SAM-dependent methyltransferase